jgi:hypothetical protein
MPARRPVEDGIQRSVVQHLRCRGARGAVWWHTPNGGARRKTEAAIQTGVRSARLRRSVQERWTGDAAAKAKRGAPLIRGGVFLSGGR